MLVQQTNDKLNMMKLYGMTSALQLYLEQPQDPPVSPVDLVGLLVDAEWTHRENRKLDLRLRQAHFRLPACIEDVDYRANRGLSKTTVLDLASSRWVHAHQNVILTGATGVGKSYLACALGQKACRDGHSVIYKRASRLFDELALARADGTIHHLLKRLAKAQVLILDDFGLEPLGAAQRKDLLEVLDDRYHASSTLVTSQLEPKDWHPLIGDPTLADAICDRLVHNAHRLKLGGESLRKTDGLTAAKKPGK
jgi:DNA replication protein DnaC